MCQSNQCNCPLCGGSFSPANGLTADEYLAKGILDVFKEMQNSEEHKYCADNPLPCPRCGIYGMSPNVLRNALSRHADIYICNICGVDEAVRIYSDAVLPISKWWVVQKILAYGE